MKVWALLAGCLAMGTGAWGGSPVVVPADDAQVFFDLAGLRGDVQRAGTQATQQLAGYGEHLTPEQQRALQEAFARAFEPGRLEEETLRRLRQGTSAALLKRVVTYFAQDPVGIQVAELERLARAPESLVLLAEFTQQVHSTIQDPKRIELSRRLDKTLAATDHVAAVWLASAKAAALGVDALLPLDRQLGAQAISRRFGAFRGRMRAAVAQAVLARYLFTYRGLGGEALESHVRFLEGKGPQSLYRKAGRAVEAVLESASRDVGSYVVERLQGRCETRAGGLGGDPREGASRKTQAVPAPERPLRPKDRR